MIKLNHVPYGKDEIIEHYGKLSEIKSKIIPFPLPFSMRLAWNPERQLVTNSYMHPLVGPAVIDALQEFYDKVGLQKIQANNWDMWAGCYNKRQKRGLTDASTHAWGISIDINPDLCKLGENPYNQPVELIEAFEKRGFVWGGKFSRPDGMHFQACKDY